MSASKFLLSISAVLCLAVVAFAHDDTCDDSYNHCDFKFSGPDELRTFELTDMSDKPFTNRIVSKNKQVEMIGILNTNASVPPEIIVDGHVFTLPDLGNPTLTPTHLKPYPVHSKKGSGIGHEVFHGNQLWAVKGHCVRVFFSSYQVVNSDGYVIENKNDVPKEMHKCVVFMTS